MQSSNNNPTPPDPWYNATPASNSAQNVYADGSYQLPDDPEYQRRYTEASRRVQKKVNFYKSLTSYVIVVSFLWLLALLTGGGWWPVWVMLGWGVGIAFQAVDAFGLGISESQRRQMIEEEMRRLKSPRQ